MAQKGKPSRAHQYDDRGVCIFCSMYRTNIERMSHVCKAWRELEVDKAEARKKKIDVSTYRQGVSDGK